VSAAAEPLIRDLAARGIHLSRNGDKLHVEAPVGTLTPEVRTVLVEAKPVILAKLSDARTLARLLALAIVEGVDPALVRALPAADVDDCAILSDDTLRAYLRALRDTDLRGRGVCPDDETAPAICRRCGPVWLHPAVAAAAPVVRSMPRVLGCPWCHVRDRSVIPRPEVSASTVNRSVR
jgi:hypothetical protein